MPHPPPLPSLLWRNYPSSAGGGACAARRASARTAFALKRHAAFALKGGEGIGAAPAIVRRPMEYRNAAKDAVFRSALSFGARELGLRKPSLRVPSFGARANFRSDLEVPFGSSATPDGCASAGPCAARRARTRPLPRSLLRRRPPQTLLHDSSIRPPIHSSIASSVPIPPPTTSLGPGVGALLRVSGGGAGAVPLAARPLRPAVHGHDARRPARCRHGPPQVCVCVCVCV